MASRNRASLGRPGTRASRPRTGHKPHPRSIQPRCSRRVPTGGVGTRHQVSWSLKASTSIPKVAIRLIDPYAGSRELSRSWPRCPGRRGAPRRRSPVPAPGGCLAVRRVGANDCRFLRAHARPRHRQRPRETSWRTCPSRDAALRSPCSGRVRRALGSAHAPAPTRALECYPARSASK